MQKLLEEVRGKSRILPVFRSEASGATENASSQSRVFVQVSSIVSLLDRAITYEAKRINETHWYRFIRYSGKTQKQIVEFVRDNYVKRQTFQR